MNFPPGCLQVPDMLKNRLGDNEIKRIVSKRKVLQVLTPNPILRTGTRGHILKKFRASVAGQWLERVEILGENNHPVPIEVLPFAIALVMREIREMGGKSVLREGMKKVGPIITDNGNVVIDADFGIIRKPAELMHKLKSLAGVVETGLFVNMTDVAYIGTSSKVEKIEKLKS